MIKFKDDSVKPNGIRTELMLALLVADQVYKEEFKECVITSLNDGHHSSTSLHYSGAAADLRIWGLDNPTRTTYEIKSRLSIDYDVILEKDHIHIEYQPRGK